MLQTKLFLEKSEVFHRDEFINGSLFDIGVHLDIMHAKIEEFVAASHLYKSLAEACPVATVLAKCNKRGTTFRRQLIDNTDWEAVLDALRRWSNDKGKNLAVKLEIKYDVERISAAPVARRSAAIIDDNKSLPIF